MARRKPVAWDVTVPDTYAEWHIDQTVREACSAANKAAANKIVKYGALSASHIFCQSSTWNQSAIEMIQEIGIQTHHCSHGGHKRDGVPVPALIYCSSKGECGRLPGRA